ncbi:hypothetical protein F383_39271 [Gossypium arboreum]|uniref:Uncharacterized protein n=1 Tax=Gossypium arboreum TaxID=29729 RepID=A0A0B0MLK4_GOSAR|nr:hypothetical protein F383_39271 [Gossypium arboreum]
MDSQRIWGRKVFGTFFNE